MPKIADEWESYRKDVLPKCASSVQLQECRRAFYCGALAFQTCLMRCLTPEPEPTQEDVELLEALDQELKEFARKVANGEA